MKTLEEFETAIVAAEEASDEMKALGYLQARLAGVRSRYVAEGVKLPDEVAALDTELATAVAAQKASK